MSAVVPPGYKQTEVGVIPEDWETLTLEGAVRTSGLVRGPFGGTLRKEFFVERGHKVYEQKNAIHGTLDRGNYFIDDEKFRELERFRVRPGDFIVSCSGTIGSIYKLPKQAPSGVINQALLKISLNSQVVVDSFFHAVFRSKAFQERIKDNSHGGAMQNLVGMDIFRKTQFQLPTKLEQQRIAEALSDADALIEGLGQLIAKKLEVKQGAMQELLSGRKRLSQESISTFKNSEIGEIPSDWHVAEVGNIANVKTGPFGSSLHEHDYVEDGTPIITVEHLGKRGITYSNLPKVSEKDWKRLSTYSLQEGDIVFSRVGSIDRNAFVSKTEQGWLFSGRLLRVRRLSSKMDTKYLSYYFHSEPFKNRVKYLPSIH